MQNLLKLNVSNQNFFREGRYGIKTLLFLCLAFCFVCFAFCLVFLKNTKYYLNVSGLYISYKYKL